MAINPVLQTGLLNQSSAQVIDGSLRFDDNNKNYLTRTLGTAGNNKTFTFSTWTKGLGNATFFCNGVAGTGDNGLYIMITAESFYVGTWTTSWQWYVDTNRLFRDDGWYHLVVSVDTTIASPASDRVKLYVNGVQETSFATANYPSQDYDTLINNTAAHAIGRQGELDGHYLDKKLSQVYFIDGQQLGPENFGFTDPLTNTWRPKKYTGTFTQSSPNNGTTWTNNTTSGSGTIGNAYDGASNTWCNITSGNTFTLTLPKTIVADTVEVWLDTDTPASFSINGGTFSSENTYSGLQFVSVATDVSLTSLAIKGGSGGSGIGLRGIRINGEILLDGLNNTGAHSFYLPMDGNSPIGEDKSGIVTPNNGSIWSASLASSSGFRSSEPQQNAFDGDTSSICSAVGSGTITFTSPVTFASNSTIRVFLHGGDHTVTVNGGSNQTISAGSFQTVTYSNSGNANFVMTFHRGGGADTGVRAIEIDGTILVDGKVGNSWTPVNFGSAELEKATGAKPILNTIHGGTSAAPGVFGSKEGFYKTVNSTSGGGNPYIFDTAGGTSTQPTLNMLRGATYSFDYSSATGHPLYFSSLSDGKHNSKAYSVQFDGTDDRLAVGSSSDYAFGTGDFTIEMFVYHTSLTGQQTYFSDAFGDQDGVYFYKTSTNTLSLYDNNNQVFTSGTIELNKWHHIALSRSSGVVRGFIDGAQVAVVADSHNYTETQYNIGDSHGSSSGEMVGYISNVRVLKGTGLYISSFTPPQTTLTNITNTVLLCCQDSDATTAVVVPSGQSITAAGNPSATNSHNPFVYNDVHGNFGVNTATSNITKFTVPHLAVDTLYYYCTNHSGMGNSISVTTDETKADPYAWKCVLALPLLGSKDDVSASINVNSTTKTTAITGNAQGVTNTSVFYGGSFVFDGNSDYIQITPTDSSTLADNLGPYTIEFFFNMDSVRLGDNTYNIMWSTSSGLTIAKWRSGISNKVYFESDGNATGWNVTSNEDVRANNWYHFAAVRDGTTIKTYLNGVLQGTKTATFTASAETWWRVGGQNANSSTHDGYMQDFRIYKGVAKYTSNFMPASTNPDILPDTPSGVSGGSKLTKITDGAVHFDGSGDYLSVADSDDFHLGTSAFTIECFIRKTANGSNNYDAALAQGSNGSYLDGFALLTSTGDDSFQTSDGSTTYRLDFDNNSFTTDGAWHHLAVTRDGSNIARLFLDGKLQSDSETWNFSIPNSSTPLYVGAQIVGGTTYSFNGFISNARIIKGTALYTKSFNPPSAPLTNVTNTKLLCCQSNNSAGTAAVSPSLGGINDGTVWSSFLSCAGGFSSSSPAVNAFNGDNTNKANNAGNSGYAQTGSFNNALIFAPSTPLTNVTKIEILTRNPSSTTAGIVNLDTGSGYGSNIVTGTGWTTVYDGTAVTLNKIRIVNTYHGEDELAGIKINDTLLLDPVSVYGDAAATNFNPFNTNINTVRGQETGYCTFNVLRERAAGYNPTFRDGNLFMDGRGDGTGTLSASSGKFYFEVFVDTVGSSGQIYLGVQDAAYSGTERGWSTAQIAAMRDNSNLYGNGNTGSGATYGAGDLMSFAFDADNNKLYIAKNGVYMNSGNPAQGTGFTHSGISFVGGYTPIVSDSNTGQKYRLNCGQKPFKYAPPDGFQPLNAANVRPETVIARPDQYIGVKLFSIPNNGSGGTVTLDNDFDMVWTKNRTHNSTNHVLQDSIRGYGDNKNLHPNLNVQQTSTNNITAVNGRTLTIGSNNNYYDNNVAWSWKAGGSKGTFNIDGEGHANASDVNMSVGALNSVTFDKSQNWTSQVSGTQNGTYPFSNMFNADGQATHAYPQNGTRATFTPSPSFSNAKTVKVWYYAPTINANTFQLNGVNVGDQMTTTAGTLTKTFNVDGFTSWSWSKGIGGDDSGMLRIDVDGVQLVDSGVTTPDTPSIAATGCSVGTRQGFSIIKYEGNGTSGATLPHGLSQTPDFALVKNLEETESWGVYHSSQGGTKYSFLNVNNDFSASSALWNNTDPTSTVLTLGNYNGTNKDNIDFIAYLWHNVPGLQKFGSYNGNSNADGRFVELGFRPALLWLKRTDAAGNWVILDTKRNPSNPVTTSLYADTPDQDYNPGQDWADILSNGFKLRATYGEVNVGSYIYCAWAEAPAFNLFGAQSNAR